MIDRNLPYRFLGGQPLKCPRLNVVSRSVQFQITRSGRIVQSGCFSLHRQPDFYVFSVSGRVSWEKSLSTSIDCFTQHLLQLQCTPVLERMIDHLPGVGLLARSTSG